MAKNPIVKPINLFLNGAGKAKMAENRMMTASSPLQPRSMRTPKPETLSLMTLPVAMTLSSNNCTIQTLISAISEVNGRMTYFSAGCRISNVNRPINKIEKMTKKRNIKVAAVPVKWFKVMLTNTMQACTPFVTDQGC